MSSPGEMIRRRSSLNKSADFSAMRSSSQVSTIPFGSTVQARVTPQEYVEAVSFHSRQTARLSPYPGQNFEDLAIFLQRSITPVSSNSQNQVGRLSSFATLYALDNTGKVVEQIEEPARLTEILQLPSDGQTKSRLLFLGGYPSSEWLTTIGALCHVDPEHFQRHLNFLSRQSYFSFPSLPSAAENIITLHVTTLGSRQSKKENSQDAIDRLRANGMTEMNAYMHKLSREENIRNGDSIVRRYSVHDETHFSIEQEISISLNYVDREWIALIWLDAGNDLSESLEGPWLTPEDRSFLGTSWRTTFYPTIRHRPKLALKSAKHVLSPEEPIRNVRFPQGALLLRRDYGKHLDIQLLKIDPFYALHELFAFVASSELQFLNLVDSKLGPETGYEILSQKTPSLSNLLYTQEILQAHIQHLYENIETIKRRGSPDWQKAPKTPELEKAAEAAASLLLRDFEFLLAKAQILSRRCETGTSVIMNSANIAESRRAMTQARRVGKLTLLAFFYVPLSFTASFFGMNFEQFGTSATIGIWLWFAVSVPVLLLSVLFYIWDVPAFARRLGLYKRMKQWWRNMY